MSDQENIGQSSDQLQTSPCRIDRIEAMALKDYLEAIKRVVLAGVRDQDVSVGLFGSMASGSVRRSSDVDVAIVPRNGRNRETLAIVCEKLENLNVPYKVELVDFSTVSERFKEEALKAVVWWRR